MKLTSILRLEKLILRKQLTDVMVEELKTKGDSASAGSNKFIFDNGELPTAVYSLKISFDDKAGVENVLRRYCLNLKFLKSYHL